MTTIDIETIALAVEPKDGVEDGSDAMTRRACAAEVRAFAGAAQDPSKVIGQKLARVAAAEAELVGVNAERDALRAENETLWDQLHGFDKNLDEAEFLKSGRWFTAADVEPDDLGDRAVLCSLTYGLAFTSRYNGTWESLHLSHYAFDWPDLLARFGPLLLVTDPDSARQIVVEMHRRRDDERTMQSALWGADRALSNDVGRYRSMHLEAPGRLLELAERVKGLAKTGRLGEPPVDWAKNAAEALGQVTAALVRVLDEQERATRSEVNR